MSDSILWERTCHQQLYRGLAWQAARPTLLKVQYYYFWGQKPKRFITNTFKAQLPRMCVCVTRIGRGSLIPVGILVPIREDLSEWPKGLCGSQWAPSACSRNPGVWRSMVIGQTRSSTLSICSFMIQLLYQAVTCMPQNTSFLKVNFKNGHFFLFFDNFIDAFSVPCSFPNPIPHSHDLWTPCACPLPILVSSPSCLYHIEPNSWCLLEWSLMSLAGPCTDLVLVTRATTKTDSLLQNSTPFTLSAGSSYPF